MSIIIALIVFGIIVFIHEGGHFLFAKKSGIYVSEFNIGMGPRLCGFTRKETKYSIRLLPIGGSCMMLGEDEASDDARAFNNQSVWARIAVVFGGPLFNFILAFIGSIILIACIGALPAKVADLTEGGAAKQAGLQVGDEILTVNNERVYNFQEVSLYLQLNPQGKNIQLEIKRDGKVFTKKIKPQYNDEYGYYMVGVSGQRQKVGVLNNLKYSVYEVRYWVKAVYKSLAYMIGGHAKASDMAGPVGIVNMIGDTYSTSKAYGVKTVLINLLNMLIMLSANLGVMNLLPLPALDGGRLVFLIIEAIRRKPIPADKEGMVHGIGFILLMILMVFLVFNDVHNIFSK